MALENFIIAIKIRKKTLRSDHPDTLELLYDIGTTKYKQEKSVIFNDDDIYRSGLYFEAKKLLNCGKEHHMKNELKKASIYYKKSLRLFKLIFPVNHSIVLKTLHCIGNAYFDESQYEKALNHYIELFEAKRLLLPLNHSDIATIIYYIGVVCQKLGRADEALNYYNNLCF